MTTALLIATGLFLLGCKIIMLLDGIVFTGESDGSDDRH